MWVIGVLIVLFLIYFYSLYNPYFIIRSDSYVLNTIQICAKVPSPHITLDNCKESYVFTFALYKNDPSVCDKYESLVKRELCYKSYAVEKGEVEICDTLSNTYGKKNDCYREIATETFNSELCEKLEKGQEFIDRCYLTIQYKYRVKDAVFCNEVVDLEMKEQCFRIGK